MGSNLSIAISELSSATYDTFIVCLKSNSRTIHHFDANEHYRTVQGLLQALFPTSMMTFLVACAFHVATMTNVHYPSTNLTVRYEMQSCFTKCFNSWHEFCNLCLP